MTSPGLANNAIARRLDLLHDQWSEFAQLPDARILRWLLRADEWRMLDTFFVKESDDRAGEQPDLFLRLHDGFADVGSYGAALVDSLAGQYEASRAELEAEGIDAAWRPPPASAEHSLLRFVHACTSLQAHYQGVMDRLAVVLVPVEVRDHAEWRRWLQAAATRLPVEVRLVVIDDVDAPALDALATAEPERVCSVVAGLDMPAAWAELARTGGAATPGGQFRVAFTTLTQALAGGDVDGARKPAASALAIAREHNWPHLEAAVHAALASGLVGAGRIPEAIAEYREVDAAGKKAEAAGDPQGTKLRLHAVVGTGAALVSAREFAQASAVYESGAPLAQQSGDALMLLECWRMAGYCHEQAGQGDSAWACGFKALDAAEAMPPQDREHSTLPFVGEGLLRLAAGSPRHVEGVEQRMAALTGRADWKPTAPAGGQVA